jgi:hypothetical protein
MFLKRITKTEVVAAEAWLDYRRSFAKDEHGKNPQPTVSQLAKDAILALRDIREMTIVRLASLMEAYAQCWALNYLAAVLESGGVWSRAESVLAATLHPIHGSGHVPGWPQIVRAVPALKNGLETLPHTFRHPTSGTRLTEPISVHLNALAVIQFWRAYRNLAVHTSRLVTRRFYDRYATLFSEMMAGTHHEDKLEPGNPMPLHDDLFSQMAAVQYRAALWMNELLVRVSQFRRGHPEAPGPITKKRFEPSFRCRALFVQGDHGASLQWTTDPAFRAEVSRDEGWRLPNISLG